MFTSYWSLLTNAFLSVIVIFVPTQACQNIGAVIVICKEKQPISSDILRAINCSLGKREVILLTLIFCTNCTEAVNIIFLKEKTD